jgi:hypothetical protein
MARQAHTATPEPMQREQMKEPAMCLDGKSKSEQRWRHRVARLQSALASTAVGRVALHVLCACIDGQIRWHVAGLARELR